MLMNFIKALEHTRPQYSYVTSNNFFKNDTFMSDIVAQNHLYEKSRNTEYCTNFSLMRCSRSKYLCRACPSLFGEYTSNEDQRATHPPAQQYMINVPTTRVWLIPLLLKHHRWNQRKFNSYDAICNEISLNINENKKRREKHTLEIQKVDKDNVINEVRHITTGGNV